jgi:hypothetical protein
MDRIDMQWRRVVWTVRGDAALDGIWFRMESE